MQIINLNLSEFNYHLQYPLIFFNEINMLKFKDSQFSHIQFEIPDKQYNNMYFLYIYKVFELQFDNVVFQNISEKEKSIRIRVLSENILSYAFIQLLFSDQILFNLVKIYNNTLFNLNFYNNYIEFDDYE